MKKGSQILKLPVVNVDANEKMGVVTGFVFDPAKKKVAALIIEPHVPMEGLRAIPFENIVSIYDTALMIENLKEPVNLSEHKSLLSVFLNDINLVGSMVVSDEGKAIGVARDFVVDPENGRILQLNVRIRGGSGERVIAHDDIIQITSAEIMARTRPGQITLGASPDAAPPVAERKTAAADHAAERKPVVEAKSYAERPPASEPAASSPKYMVEEIKKEIRTELFALFETFFSDRIKTHFLEMARMILERINQIQPEEKLKSLRDEIIGELSKLPKKDDAREERRGELEEQAGSLSLLVEEKIKQGAGNRLDSLVSRIDEMEKTLGGIREKAEAASGDVRNALREQAEALKNVPLELRLGDGDSLEPRIRDAVAKIDKLSESLDLLDPIAEKTDALKEQVGGIRDEMISLREIQDSLRQTWLEIATGLSERFDTLESRFREDESRGEEKSRALIDKINGVISAQNRGIPGKDEFLSLTTKLETASARLKNLEDEASGSMEEILAKIDDSARVLTTELHAAVTRSAAPLLDNMKRSLEKRIEEMKTRTETFRDEMVELQDVVRTSTMRVEEKFDERLADEVGRLSKTLSGIASAVTDGETQKSSMDEVIASIRETAASLSEKIGAQNDPLKERLATQQKYVVEQLQALRESVSKAAEASAKKMDEAASAVSPGVLSLNDALDGLSAKFASQESVEKLRDEILGLISGYKEEIIEGVAPAVEKLGGRLEEMVSRITFDEETVSLKEDILAGVNEGLAAQVEKLKDAIRPSGAESGFERLENEIEELRNFVKQKVAEIADLNEIAREDTQKRLLDGLDNLLRKNVSDRLESFISKNLDSSISRLLEKIADQPEAAKGIFGRGARPKEKPAPKPRTPEKADTAAEKRLEYLIGRTVGKDLLDDDGNPIVAKGTVVDEKLLAVMREKRRLLDLIQCIDFTQ